MFKLMWNLSFKSIISNPSNENKVERKIMDAFNQNLLDFTGKKKPHPDHTTNSDHDGGLSTAIHPQMWTELSREDTHARS